MGDRRLRELERRVAGGDVEAGARLLRARLRVGELGVPGVALAAFAGDPAARLALGDEAPRVETDLRRWPEALEAGWGKSAAVRAGLAVAERVLGSWEAWQRDGRRFSLRVALRLSVPPARDSAAAARSALVEAARWCLSPDAETGHLERAAVRLGEAIVEAQESGRSGRWTAASAGEAARLAALAALTPRDTSLWGGLPPRPGVLARSAVEEVLSVIGLQERVREAVSAALIPWALGSGDALVQRLLGGRAREGCGPGARS